MNYLLDNYYMDTILQLQQNYKRSTLVRYGFGALAAAALLRGVYLLAKEQFANRQIAFRKKQLARDVYVLQGDELVNFPWNSGNIGDWLYRRVQVSGRPLYYKECMVRNKSVELAGYEEVVPLVTRETEQKQEGIMLSKGFVPEKFKDPNSRVRIEDVTEQTFVGFVSRLDELSESGFGEGNVSIYRKHDFTHANLQDFADASQFSNKSQVAVALIEELDSTGPIDQRNPQRRAHGIQYSVQYPYKKTYSGALQLRTMPWEYRNESYIWFGLSALGLLRFLF